MFYLNKVIEDNMSRTELEHVVKAQLYEHTGKALNNFDILFLCRLSLFLNKRLYLVSKYSLLFNLLWQFA